MKSDIQSLFFRDAEIPVTASATTESEILDIRKNGIDRTKDLVVRIHVDKPSTLAATSATLQLKTAMPVTTGTPTWTTLASATLSADAVDKNNEIIIQLPRSGVKQLLKVDVVKGQTALAAAVKLYGGLDSDDEYDYDASLTD